MKLIATGKVTDGDGHSWHLITPPTWLEMELNSIWNMLWWNGFIATEDPDDDCPFPI